MKKNSEPSTGELDISVKGWWNVLLLRLIRASIVKVKIEQGGKWAVWRSPYYDHSPETIPNNNGPQSAKANDVKGEL